MHFEIVGRITDIEVHRDRLGPSGKKAPLEEVREGPLEKAERERKHPIFG
jgi:hypothetical protein